MQRDREKGHGVSDQKGMVMGKGWICLHRKIQDSAIWMQDEPYDMRSAWIDLLLTANHEDRKIIFDGHMREVKRGQILTSVTKLAERWKWTPKKARKFLRLLEEDQMIEKKSDNRATLLTLLNYAKYQGSSGFEGKQPTQLLTQLPTQQGTNSRPTNNNYNNYNNVEQRSVPYSDGTTFLPKKGDKAYKDVKLTQFHNMETNKYDFDALEKYLLERDRPSEMS